ncbi:NAD(P)-dependent oxidoreductase [Bacillus swezeyi]|uniref:NAD(P)-dependent oxidoreductase n=1 Tax=Bacillus swezeyi TaxID=1925020 RepID=UPI002E20F0FE
MRKGKRDLHNKCPRSKCFVCCRLGFRLLLSGARSIPQSNAAVKSGLWHVSMGYELDGKTLRLIGFGEIGKKIARRALGFNMNMLAYGTYKDYKAAKRLNVRFSKLDDVLAKSDFVCISTSLRPDTYHLINEERIAKMKKTAFLINIVRGEVVDENAPLAFCVAPGGIPTS